jgi:hypothetical protein
MEQTEQTEKTVVKESSLKTTSPSGEPERAHHIVHRTFLSVISSRKLWMTAFAMITLYLAYWRQVNYLYTFGTYPSDIAQAMITAYIGITRDFMVAFTAVIASYLGIQGLVQWKHGTESTISQAASFVKQKVEEHKEEKKEIKLETYVKEEGVNTDQPKPYAALATEEN